ncbi:hypothetical protein AVEN_54619-1 [Araneus ventricosus]|uniref:Uncharacterized protein n=1 Tax=Araneus ventricosus TaxID=182803 RepID=A0A4Y2BMP4_ARAVE|nr:hypothetical protein AVEN_54619-1 [Araneus ventricosus]
MKLVPSELHYVESKSPPEIRLRWPSGKAPASESGVPGSKPDSTEDPSCIRHVAREIIRKGQTPSRCCCVEAWREGRCSKSRGTSQNSPCVASKRDVSITKLNSSGNP